jgi:uncharacterized DUF497 family protein
MKYVWDEKKNKSNISKHGIDFNDVIEIFENPMLVCIDNRTDYGEERLLGIGVIKGIIATIVYTEDDKKKTIRIISVRKADKNERKSFKEKV